MNWLNVYQEIDKSSPAATQKIRTIATAKRNPGDVSKKTLIQKNQMPASCLAAIAGIWLVSILCHGDHPDGYNILWESPGLRYRYRPFPLR
jgi:hypothetical protein